MVDQYKLVFEGTSLQNSSKPKICSTAFTVVYFHPFQLNSTRIGQAPSLGQIPRLHRDKSLKIWRTNPRQGTGLTLERGSNSFLQQTHCHIKALNPWSLGWQVTRTNNWVLVWVLSPGHLGSVQHNPCARQTQAIAQLGLEILSHPAPGKYFQHAGSCGEIASAVERILRA